MLKTDSKPEVCCKPFSYIISAV